MEKESTWGVYLKPSYIFINASAIEVHGSWIYGCRFLPVFRGVYEAERLLTPDSRVWSMGERVSKVDRELTIYVRKSCVLRRRNRCVNLVIGGAGCLVNVKTISPVYVLTETGQI